MDEILDSSSSGTEAELSDVDESTSGSDSDYLKKFFNGLGC